MKKINLLMKFTIFAGFVFFVLPLCGMFGRVKVKQIPTTRGSNGAIKRVTIMTTSRIKPTWSEWFAAKRQELFPRKYFPYFYPLLSPGQERTAIMERIKTKENQEKTTQDCIDFFKQYSQKDISPFVGEMITTDNGIAQLSLMISSLAQADNQDVDFMSKLLAAVRENMVQLCMTENSLASTILIDCSKFDTEDVFLPVIMQNLELLLFYTQGALFIEYLLNNNIGATHQLAETIKKYIKGSQTLRRHLRLTEIGRRIISRFFITRQQQENRE